MLSSLRNERGLLASMGFNNMMHAMHEYRGKKYIIINGKHLLASWGKKKEKHVEGKKGKKFVRLPGRVLNSRPSCFPRFPMN